MQFKTSYHAHPIKLAKTNKRIICIVGEGTWNPSPSDILLVGVLMRRKYWIAIWKYEPNVFKMSISFDQECVFTGKYFKE